MVGTIPELVWYNTPAAARHPNMVPYPTVVSCVMLMFRDMDLFTIQRFKRVNRKMGTIPTIDRQIGKSQACRGHECKQTKVRECLVDWATLHIMGMYPPLYRVKNV